MSKRYGYGRVSSKGQEKNGNSLEDQERQLIEAGCDKENIELETYTGTKMERPKFTKLLEKLQAGDTLTSLQPARKWVSRGRIGIAGKKR
jgi:DNA invertase Pin-like site-specific DNA recombinase